jgi:hypothetical protein
MKYFLIVLLFASCAKLADSTEAPKEPVVPMLFAKTENQSEALLKENAKLLLRLGRPITLDNAKRCVTTEIHRPQVQLICVLLWSQNQEENSFLEGILVEKAQLNREWAIALFFQKIGLRNLSVDHLLAVMQQIGNEPLPLFVSGLEYWYSQQKGQTNHDLKRIWNLLLLRYREQPSHLVSFLRLTWLLQRSQFQQELQKHCSPRRVGKAKWICWKSLLFIEQDKNISSEMKSILRQQYPSQWNDSEWRQFRNYFPKNANFTQKTLEAK